MTMSIPIDGGGGCCSLPPSLAVAAHRQRGENAADSLSHEKRARKMRRLRRRRPKQE